MSTVWKHYLKDLRYIERKYQNQSNGMEVNLSEFCDVVERTHQCEEDTHIDKTSTNEEQRPNYQQNQQKQQKKLRQPQQDQQNQQKKQHNHQQKQQDQRQGHRIGEVIELSKWRRRAAEKAGGRHTECGRPGSSPPSSGGLARRRVVPPRRSARNPYAVNRLRNNEEDEEVEEESPPVVMSCSKLHKWLRSESLCVGDTETQISRGGPRRTSWWSPPRLEDTMLERVSLLEQRLCELVHLNRALIEGRVTSHTADHMRRSIGYPTPEWPTAGHQRLPRPAAVPWLKEHAISKSVSLDPRLAADDACRAIAVPSSTSSAKGEGFLTRHAGGLYFSPRQSPNTRYLVHDFLSPETMPARDSYLAPLPSTPRLSQAATHAL